MKRRWLWIGLVVVLSLGMAAVSFYWRRREGVTAAAVSENGVAANPFLPAGVDDLGWPGVRGPGYDGRSAEIHLADEWPEEGPPVLWTRALGQGYSGFTAADGRLYTQYQTISGQYVVCLDAATGDTVWEYRYGWPYELTGLYPGPRSTPTLANGRVYFEAPDGLVGCLTNDGSLRWSVNLKEKFDGQGTDFGCACSPTVVDGLVIMPVGGKGASMVALDAETGAVVWSEGDDSASYTPAMPISIDGQSQVIGYLEHVIAGFDLKSGKLLWREPISHGYDEHSAWPVYQEPYLWTSAPFQAGSQLYKLTGGEEPACELVWHTKIMSNDIASSVLVDGFLYGFDVQDPQSKVQRPTRGAFRCMEFVTGEERWVMGEPKARRKLGDGMVGHATVLAVDEKLILFNDTGEVILARSSPDSYQELARATVMAGEVCWTAPALHRGRLFLRNSARAACLYLGDPHLLDAAAKQQSLYVADIPQGEFRDLSSILGVEPEYAMDAPHQRWLREWCIASMALLGLAALVTLPIYWLFQPRVSWSTGRRVFMTLAFVLGLAGTTLLSLWRNDFVFTWPLPLFLSFQMAVYSVRLRRPLEQDTTSRWRERIAPAAFVACCMAYFLGCRRLSLPTEWVFLTGFAAALPLCLLAGWLARREKPRPVTELLVVATAFLAYYGASLVLLFVKYDIVEY